MAQTRLLNLQEVLQYELGPLPWSLSTGDGCLIKTQKSKLLHQLERYTEPVEDVPVNAALVVDAMAMLQSLNSPAVTFGELAKQIFDMLTLSFVAPNSRVDFVIDRYPTISIKESERRCRRKERGTIRVHILSSSQKLPIQRKKFLSNSSNKEDLLHFLAEEWSRQEYVATRLTSGKSLFVTDRAECYRLTRSEEGKVCQEAVPALQSKHEEADTRLVLHAAHAGNVGHSHVVIKSPDTDVALLAMAHRSQINGTVLFLTGNKHRRRYVNLSQIGRKLGPQVCRVLLGMHALTGCDSTSAFVGKGKVQALQLVTSCKQI